MTSGTSRSIRFGAVFIALGVSVCSSQTYSETLIGLNGRNYSWTRGNGRSYQPCLSFYPQDILITGLGAANGTAVTAVNLLSSTELASALSVTFWTLADANGTIGANFLGGLPASIPITNGPTHNCGFPTQTLQYDNTVNLHKSTVAVPSPSILTISGWLLPSRAAGTASGNLIDLVQVTTATGSAVFQYQQVASTCGAPGFEIEATWGGTFHSSCISASGGGGPYFFSMQVDRSATLLATLAVYTTSGGVFTELSGSPVTRVLGGSANAITTVSIGNGETGTNIGADRFQNVMIDYTNHVQPNLPH